MKKKGFISLIFSLFPFLPFNGRASFNYDAMIYLDAEDLAEAGIKEAYEKDVLPLLRQYVERPASIEEILDNYSGSYSVVANGKQYDIYDQQADGCGPWPKATYAMFDIVNRQLASSDRKFYAFYSSNDLSGMFLTAEEYQRCVDEIIQKKASRSNLPYFPTMETPWFGFPHDEGF